MMKIIYNGSIAKLHEAVQKANELLAGTAFYDAIAQKPGFHFSTATGTQVATSLKKCGLELNVKTYKKYFSKVLGFEDPNDPTSIHINVAGNKLDRSIGSIAGTFVHEAVHAADADDEQISYPHNGNKPDGNEDAAAYWIGNLAIHMIDHPDQLFSIEDVAMVAHAVEDTAPDDVNFTFHVTVLGGEQAPAPIRYILKGPHNDNGSSKQTFSKSYTLPSGAYDLTVSGSSPDEGETRLDIEGDFDGNPDTHDSRTNPPAAYSMRLSFIIN